MQAPVQPATTRSLFGEPREWRRDLAVAAASGVFLGLVGPFGSYLNGSRLTLLAYWVASLCTGTICFGVTLRPALRLAPRLRLSPPAALAAATILLALPMSLLCHLAAAALWPGAIGRIGWLVWYAQTLVISAPLTVVYGLLNGVHRSCLPGTAAMPPVTVASAAAEPSPRPFLSRLPDHLERRLIALQMEDHYVRAHTPTGSALILIPLHQAIRELGATPGIKVHRSWWVARDAVTGFVTESRAVRLKLSNGIEAPVARSFVAEVRASGLLVRRPD